MNLNHALTVAASIAIAACSSAPVYQDVLHSWSGAPEAELLQRWGPPLRSSEDGGRKHLTYESRRTLHVPGTAPVASNLGMTGGSPPMTLEMSCTTTFELAEAKVVAWSHTGNDCGAKPASPFRS